MVSNTRHLRDKGDTMSEQTKWKPLGDAAGRLDAENVQQVVTWAKRLVGWWRKLRGMPVRPNDQP